MLRCKFRLSKVEKTEKSRSVELHASSQLDGDNKDWSQWTPEGTLRFNVTNPQAFPTIDSMNQGDHFYIDITPVRKGGE